MIFLFRCLWEVISLRGPCFTALNLERFLKKYEIQWSTAMVYAPMSSKRAEQTVQNNKKALVAPVQPKAFRYSLMVSSQLFRWRSYSLASEISRTSCCMDDRPHFCTASGSKAEALYVRTSSDRDAGLDIVPSHLCACEECFRGLTIRKLRARDYAIFAH